MIFHKNRLPADDSHEISCLIFYFQKGGKIWNGHLLQIIGGALRVNNRNIPTIAGIRVSCNFCEDFKTADLVILLPSKISHHTGQAEVKVTHSLLQERDFRCLEGAIHTSGRRKVCIRKLCVTKPTKMSHAFNESAKFYKVPVIKKTIPVGMH